MTRYDLIELYAGLGAVSLAALGASSPPVSRVGSKSGYTAPILRALGIEPGSARRVLLVESDAQICDVLRLLTSSDDERRQHAAETIRLLASAPAREVWEHARTIAGWSYEADPAWWLLYTAGARGGIGGFKGGHVRRASVDGFIPSRLSLAKRVAGFRMPEGAEVEIARARVEDCDPTEECSYEPTAVYLDPPYRDSALLQQVRANIDRAADIAERWRAAGHRVVLSERVRPQALSAAWEARRIDGERRGQTRRSLTRSTEEWLFVAGAGGGA